MKKGWVRPLVATAVVVAVASLGWLATQFLAADDPKLERDTPAAAATNAPDRGAPASITPETESPTPVRNIEAVVGAPPVTTAPPLPASYRKALSGLRGRLVEEDGKPVAGLKVELLEILGSGLQADFERVIAASAADLPTVPPLSIADGVSDEKGVFELHGALLSGFHGLGVDLGGPRGTLRFVDRTLVAGESTDLGDITLSPFVKWTGTVVDEDGAPVPDARVRATLLPTIAFQPGVADAGRIAALMEIRTWGNRSVEVIDVPDSARAWEAKLPFPTARTKTDGTFELAGVPQGLATLIVDRDGFTGSFKGPTATAKRDRDIGTITLARGRTLTGTVVDTAGTPIAGAQVIGGVVIDAVHLVIAMPASAPTAADGAFAIEHLSEQGGDLRVAARNSAADAWTVVQVEDDARPVTITLPVGRSLEVTLVDAAGGTVPEAELLLRSRRGPPFLTFAPPMPIPPDRVEKIAPGKLRVRGLQPGSFHLLGRAAGLALAQTNVEIVDSAEGAADAIEATLTFTSAGAIAVRVLDRDTQAPIEHAMVSAQTDERMAPPLVTRRSDATGVATLAGLPRGALKVRAAHPAYAAVTLPVALESLPADAAPLDILLGPGAVLHGRVHQAGKPLLEPMLFLLTSHGGDHSIDDDVPRFAVPGLDGTFTLKGLPPGRARWQLMPRIFAGDPQMAAQMIASARSEGSERRGNVELAEGKTTELEIDLDAAAAGKPGRIAGVVRLKKGSADFVVRVDCSMPNEQQARVQKTVVARSNQRFTIDDVPAGWVNLTIERSVEPAERTSQDDSHHRPPPLHQDWFELDGGSEHTVDVEFELLVQELRVLDGNGAPVAGTSVELLWTQTVANGSINSNVWGLTDKSGIARLEVPRPGRYTARSQNPELGRASLELDLPSRELPTLELQRGVPFAGRIEIDPDPGTAHIWFSVAEIKDGDQFDSAGWVQLENGKRDFQMLGLGPGKYRAHVFLDEGKNGQLDFELGHNGDDRLVLRFKLR